MHEGSVYYFTVIYLTLCGISSKNMQLDKLQFVKTMTTQYCVFINQYTSFPYTASTECTPSAELR